ncbi:MAG: DEAD/DEAH box helicase [Nanoarchaeota archaeon]|nr:DEAD/DEAH box helicase [Nanoarchaeota archaeon]MBU1103172.1 DEAD/DEAH box helicase [Nanoarchaeota archaeon]
MAVLVNLTISTYIKMTKFSELGLCKNLLKVIGEAGFDSPTEIQEKSIPFVLKGKDVIGNSATGSGKTLAFAVGIFEKVTKGQGVQALVMVPTRELAEQVTKSLRFFSKYYDFKTLDVYGGVSISEQVTKIRKSEIIVGTPGRILDHLRRGTLDLSKVKVLVLDEADRMVDMGFLPDVETIVKRCPKKRQTMLFSATMTPDIDYMKDKYMEHAKQIEAESYIDAGKLKQIYYEPPNHLKFSLLCHLLKQDKTNLVMVFCNTRMNSDMVADNLQRFGLKAMAIHGGLTQSKRKATLEDFHAEDVQILVCTDVAARGLDIKNVSHVYNYDIPPSSNDYIHRVGRTARAGKEGKAISIVTNRDYENFRKVLMDDSLKIIEEKLPDNIEEIAPRFVGWKKGFRGEGRDSRGGGSSRGGGGGGSRGGRSFDRGGRRDSRGGSSPRGRSFGGSSRGDSRGGSSPRGGGSRSGGSGGGARGFQRGGSGGGQRSFGGSSRGDSRGGGSGGGRRDSRGGKSFGRKRR